MSKRRAMFLAKNPIIKRFTKNTIVKNFGISAEEFDQLLTDGFIEKNNNDVCISCHRTWDHEQEQCLYCGEESYAKQEGFYSYK